MYWIVLGVIVALGLAMFVPPPFNVAIGAGLLLGVLMHIASLLEQLLGQGADLKVTVEPDPDALLRRVVNARLARRGRFRPRRREPGGE